MWEAILAALMSTAATLAILGFVGKAWFEARLKASIEHEQRKQFEMFSRELNRKEKIELVAELLAEYMKTPHGEKLERQQRLLLNKLSLQSSLWLPPELAIELGKRLQNQSDAKTPFQLILLARKLLIGDEGISEKDVTIWDARQETSAPPIVAR